jgi:hypothetical protein
VSGLQPNATTAASSPESDTGDDYLPYLLQPLHDLRPGLPASPGPGPGNNNKNTQKLAQQAAQAVTPLAQALLAPVFNAAQSVLTNGVNCVTRLQLGSCLQTLATLPPYASGAGEVAGLTGAEEAGAAAADSSGEAIVYLDHGAGHASIQVDYGGVSVHSEQAGTTGTEAVGQMFSGQMSDGHIFRIRVPLPNAARAQAFQNATEGYVFGPYDLETRSCVTYCADVLRAGGVPNVPEPSAGWRATTRWLWSLDN